MSGLPKVSTRSSRPEASEWLEYPKGTVYNGVQDVSYLVPLSEWTSTLIVSHNNPGPPYRSGSGFHVVHEGVDCDTHERSAMRDFGFYSGHHEGGCGVFLMPNPLPYGTVGDMTTTLFGLGSKAFAAARPDKPIAAVAQMLGELKDYRDFNKPVKRSGKNPLRDAASDYLGYEFGARPFLDDLNKLYHLQTNLAKRLEFLRNNNGKKIRRRLNLGETEESFDESEYGSYVMPTNYLVRGSQTQTRHHRLYHRYWYSGAFTFWIPEIKLPNGKWPPGLRAGQIGGNPLSVELLYELTPWSWLVDWFSTLGDALSNLSNYGIDHVVQDYGFVMGHGISESRYEVPTPIWGPDGSLTNHTFHARRFFERKQRVAGVPYGFGVDPNSLSHRQAAILAALGLSRL